MRRNLLGSISAVGVMFVAACGSSGSSGGGTVYPTDVTVNPADGAIGVGITGFSVTVTWPSGNAVDADTVTATSFYIVPMTGSAQEIKGNWIASKCDVGSAIPNIELETNVDGGTSSSKLSLFDDLTAGATYSVCVTSAIRFSDGATFAGMTNSFATAE